MAKKTTGRPRNPKKYKIEITKTIKPIKSSDLLPQNSSNESNIIEFFKNYEAMHILFNKTLEKNNDNTDFEINFFLIEIFLVFLKNPIFFKKHQNNLRNLIAKIESNKDYSFELNIVRELNKEEFFYRYDDFFNKPNILDQKIVLRFYKELYFCFKNNVELLITYNLKFLKPKNRNSDYILDFIKEYLRFKFKTNLLPKKKTAKKLLVNGFKNINRKDRRPKQLKLLTKKGKFIFDGKNFKFQRD
jgi:hypothetical protein